MKLEKLTRTNVGFAVGLAKEMHGISTFGVDGPEFDWMYTQANMLATIPMWDYYFTLALDDGGEYCGAVCGKVAPFYFSPKLFGVEEAWYVREGTKDRTRIAIALMNGFVDWCLDDQGALHVQSGDIAAINSLAVDSLYKHMGFRRYGSSYKYVRTL